AEAEPLYQRALRDRERVLGADHPGTLTSVNDLGLLYSSQGRYRKAEPLFLRAFRDNERVLGADHPDTLGSVNNLGGLYESQGRYAEAEPLFLRALQGTERVLGTTHPNTKIIRKNWKRCRKMEKSGRTPGSSLSTLWQNLKARWAGSA